MSLAEVIADHRAAGDLDVGAPEVFAGLRGVARNRSPAHRAVHRRLVRLFSAPLGARARLRGAGLLAFDLLPPAKSALARLSLGAADRIPRLARGVPLSGMR